MIIDLIYNQKPSAGRSCLYYAARMVNPDIAKRFREFRRGLVGSDEAIYQKFLGNALEKDYPLLKVSTPFHSLSALEQQNALSALAQRKFLLEAGLEIASINAKEIAAFLQKKGALLVAGHFGRAYYLDPAEQITSLFGKTLFGWKKGAPTLEKPLMHAIVLVGFYKKYFIYLDPAEKVQQLFVVSIKRLETNRADLAGIRGMDLFGNVAYLPKKDSEEIMSA